LTKGNLSQQVEIDGLMGEAGYSLVKGLG